mmetsp:Transcript_65366/g.202467  ORF Transcript_65366/g.202467 Transcript_65366/m.202467 type:complete len:234 (-) Transcript_65366:1639-2340(-)
MVSRSPAATVPPPLASAARKASATRFWTCRPAAPPAGSPESSLPMDTPPEDVETVGVISHSSPRFPSFSMRRILRSAADSSVSFATRVLWDIVETIEGGSACERSSAPMESCSRLSVLLISACRSRTRRWDSERSGSPSSERDFAASLSRHLLRSCRASLEDVSTSCCWRQAFFRAPCFRWLDEAWPCQMSMQDGHVTQRKPWQMRTLDLSSCWSGWTVSRNVMLAKSENGRP